MSPKRLLLVTDEMEVGGSQRQIRHLLGGLDCSQWQPELLFFRNPSFLVGEIERMGIPVHHLPKSRRIDVPFLVRYAAWLRRARFDVVHAFSLTAELWTALACMSMRRPPSQVSSVRGLYLDALPAFWRAKRFAIARSAAVIANSDACAAAAVEHAGVARARIEVVANGVAVAPPLSATTRARLRDRIACPQERTLVMFVGRLVPVKNLACLIRAMARLPQGQRPWLAVAGDGPLRGALEATVVDAGLDADVHFLGERADAAELVQVADVLVLPSLQEGMSNALLEAMAAGCPVIASAVGGNVELVEHGLDGLLFPSDDDQALSMQLRQLHGDPALRVRMGMRARQRVTSDHGVERMVAATAAVYDRCLQARNGRAPSARDAVPSRRMATTAAATPAPRTMRVLMLLEGSYPTARGGGAEAQVRTLTGAMRARGRRVTIVVPLNRDGPPTAVARVDGVPVIRLRYPPVRRLGGPALWLALATFLIGRRDAYDVWHVHGTHSWAVVCTFLGRALGKRVVIKVPSTWDLTHGALAHGTGPLATLSYRALAGADGWQAISQRIAVALRARGLPPARIAAIPNAVDTARFRVISPSPGVDMRLLFIGRLVDEKDLFTLLEAFAELVAIHAGASLLIVGSGPLQEALEARTSTLGLTRQVTFAGHREDIEAVLAHANVGVLPSRFEGLSNALLESMAAGLPMVASRVSGNEDFVRHGHNGWLFEAGDRAGLAACLAEAAALSPGQRRTMGECARETVARKAGIDTVLDRLAQLYAGDAHEPAAIRAPLRSA